MFGIQAVNILGLRNFGDQLKILHRQFRLADFDIYLATIRQIINLIWIYFDGLGITYNSFLEVLGLFTETIHFGICLALQIVGDIVFLVILDVLPVPF
jgi:hypothetical protein